MRTSVCDNDFIILIPARAGSKGVPHKNRKLLSYTLDSIPTEHWSKIWVSTDDPFIKDICKQHDIRIHDRKPNTASDNASSKQMLHEFIHEQRITKTIICLYLTYPERTWEDISRAYNFYKSHKATSLLCRKEVKQHPYLMLEEVNTIYGKQIINHNLYRRQDYPKVFEISHFISIIEPWKFRELNNNLYNEKTIFFPINPKLDIDTPADLEKFIANKPKVLLKQSEPVNIVKEKSIVKKADIEHGSEISSFDEFIKGKNVIIVGPAPELIGTGYGKLIDAHDVVIRTNGAFSIMESYGNDYGTRCDVLYTNAFFTNNQLGSELPKIVTNGTKYVCYKTAHRINLPKSKKNLQFRQWEKTRGTHLTGMYIIEEMKAIGAKSITVTGMNFYADAGKEYTGGYLPANFKYNRQRESNLHDYDGAREKFRDMIKNKEIKLLSTSHSFNHFLFMITTYNRINFLKKTIEGWDKTRNKNYKWTLVIADDGSDDGTLKYLDNLKIKNVDIIIVKNQRRGVHYQTNSLFKIARSIDFDYGFKADDDLLFLQKGWEDLYANASNKTGYYHLIHCDQEWCKRRGELRTTKPAFGVLENYQEYTKVQGALWTFNKDVLLDTGFFDMENFNLCGYGHVDFSLRACRLGYNDIKSPYDAMHSNKFILLNKKDYFATDRRNDIWNTPEIKKKKQELMILDRGYIPYNELKYDINGKVIQDIDISFIIPIRGREDQRTGLEYNTEKYFGKYNYEMIYVVQEEEDLFKRGQLCNIGFKESKGKVVIFQDVDIRHLHEFDPAEKLEEFNSPYVAFDKIYQLYENKIGEYDIFKTEERLKGFGACAIFYREQFMASGGFSNLIFGWGAEDNIMNQRIGFVRFKQDLGHVWHEPMRTNINVHRSPWYKNNVDVMNTDNSRNRYEDGYKQTIYDTVSVSGNKIINITVKNIRVPKDFTYTNMYKDYKKYDK